MHSDVSRGVDLATGPAVPRWFHPLLVLAVVAVNLAQQAGRITFDTKLDLQLDPGGFLVRSLTLWNPDSALGELQNQASGYLFPLGPVYLLGHVLHVPVWVWERLFSALLLLLAYEGMRRVVRAWGGFGAWPAVLAGLSYMLAPRLLSTIGALTGEGLATCVLPWTVLPLVLALRGRLAPGRAALLSAATVPFMGGHNATEVLAALAFPTILLLVNGLPWRPRLALFGRWVGLVVLVSLWWLLPLLMLGRYGSPFLSYVESARTTTDLIGWLSALRGTDHWVTFLAPGDSSSWQAGFALSARPTLLVATALVAGLGLLGLCSRRLANRGALVVALLVGLFALTAGSGSLSGSLLDHPWTAALDGALAPFRNVHKFDPVVRMVLALGFAATAQAALAWAARRRTHSRRVPATVVLVALAVPLLVSSAPSWGGDLRDDAGFTAVPDSWHQAADYLRDQPGPVRALVLPGAGFAIQTWGRTIDEPLQVLDSPPWSVRSQTPLMPPGTIRMLDGLEAALVAGRPEPTLSAVIARAGITHVVLRNDLDYRHVDSPRPELVHRVFDGAPGLVQVANFGRSETIYPAVEVYAVSASSPDPRIRLFAADDAVTVSGGSETMRQLLTGQLLDPSKPMLRSTTPDKPVDVVTDSLRRVERNFGRVHLAASDVMTAGSAYRNQRAAHDYLYPDAGGSTVARYSAISEVLASSSKGYADTSGAVQPEEGPYAAVDGSLLTSWITAPFVDPRGSWIELRFPEPTIVGRTSLRFDLLNGAGVRTLRVDTDGATRAVTVDLNGDVKGLNVEPAPTRRIRFTITDTNNSIRPVTLNEINIEGVAVARTLVPPGHVADGSSVALEGGIQRPACIGFFGGLNCGADYQQLTTDSQGWRRELTVDEDTAFLVSGTVVAAGGQDVADLMGPLDPRKVRVTATSWFGGDPAVIPQNAVDGKATTTWVAAETDTEPVLDLRWQAPRRITRVLPMLSPGTPAALPSRLRIESDEGTQIITLGELGTGIIDPVTTTRLRITLLPGNLDEGNPLGMSELRVQGLQGLKYHADAGLPTGRTCGLGPTVFVGDTRILTQITGHIGDLISGAPMRMEGCAKGAAGADVSAGAQTVRVKNVGGFEVRDLILTPAFPTVTEPVEGSATVRAWGGVDRDVAVDVDEDALLAVTQSTNPGWVATVDGKRLAPVEIDGWMQGWRLPAGTTGVVRLHFAPQTPYLVGLFGGLAAGGRGGPPRRGDPAAAATLAGPADAGRGPQRAPRGVRRRSARPAGRDLGAGAGGRPGCPGRAPARRVDARRRRTDAGRGHRPRGDRPAAVSGRT